MALSLYKLDEDNGCTFDDGDGVDTINSIIDWSINESGTTLDGTSDGIGTVQSQHIDHKIVEVTITTKNPGNVTDNGWSVGTCGTLVLKGVKRACGDSVDDPPVTLTATCDEATITALDFSVPDEGDSACNMTFRCVSADGSAIFAYS